MSYQILKIIGLFSVVFLTACQGSSGNGNSNPTEKSPVTPDQALAKLNSRDQASFNRWKTNLVKACDVSEIFAGSQSEVQQMDLSVFFQKTGQSLVLAGPQQTLTLLGAITSPSGQSDTSFESTVQDSSGTYALDAKSKNTGGLCEVYLYGQKVYSSQFITGLQVVASFDPSSISTKPVTSALKMGPVSNDQVGQVMGTSYGALVISALQPTTASINWVAQTLGMSLEDAKKFVKLSTTRPLGFLNFSQWPTISLFSLNEENSFGVLGPKEAINSILSTSSTTQKLTANIRVESVQFSELANSKDSPYLSFELTASSKMDPSFANVRSFSLLSMSKTNTLNYDDSQATHCFINRSSLLAQGKIQGSSPFLPSYKDTLGSCNLLSADFTGAILKSNESRGLLNAKFTGFRSDSRTDFAGWDQILTSVTLQLFDGQQNIQSVLDPSGSSYLIDQISRQAETIRKHLGATPDLGSDSEFVHKILSVSINWVLGGLQVSDNELIHIMDSLNNTIVVFPRSTQSLLSSLAQDPHSTQNAATLEFALSLGNDYKNAAMAFAAAGNGLGEDDFISSKIDDVLQQKYSQSQFAEWTRNLNAAQVFAARDRAHKGDSDDFFENNLRTVVDRGVHEGWTDSQYSQLEIIAQLSKYSDFCTQGAVSASTLANCSTRFGEYSNESGKFFDPVFGDRYAGASKVFQTYMQQLSDQSYFFDRDSLQRAFFSGIWGHCAKAEFETRLSNLSSLVTTLSQSSFTDRSSIENQMRDLLKDCSTAVSRQ